MQNLSFEQWIVIGGTGQTGHRVLELIVPDRNTKILATSRSVEKGIPTGSLASTVMSDVSKWRSKVEWFAVDLEAEPSELKTQLFALAKRLDPKKKTALVFAAAFTNVEVCETDPKKCERINEQNTIAVLDWANQEFGAKIVFYSTDYVFDGKAGPYTEDVPRHAISKYGHAKVLVEEWLESKASNALILRTTGVYDYLPGSKNFLMQMLELWKKEQMTKIPSDQFANPVCAEDLARATVELLKCDASGIFNVAGGTQMARSHFAALIADTFGYDLGLIQPIQTSELNQKAKRPLKGGLVCKKLELKIGWAPRTPQDVLAMYLQRGV